MEEIEVYLVNIPEALFQSCMASSKSEARRLIDQGAVRVNMDFKLEPKEYTIYCQDDSFILSIGHKKYKRIILQRKNI